jgi:hypothetical protein
LLVRRTLGSAFNVQTNAPYLIDQLCNKWCVQWMAVIPCVICYGCSSGLHGIEQGAQQGKEWSIAFAGGWKVDETVEISRYGLTCCLEHEVRKRGVAFDGVHRHEQWGLFRNRSVPDPEPHQYDAQSFTMPQVPS